MGTQRLGRTRHHQERVTAVDHDDTARRIHDAAVYLGASCHQGCWFGNPQDQPMAYDNLGKSLTIDRARALKFLATLTN